MSEQGGEARNEPSRHALRNKERPPFLSVCDYLNGPSSGVEQACKISTAKIIHANLMTASMHIRVRCDENKKGATAEDILLRWIASVHRRGEDREIGRHAPPHGS